MTADDRDDSLPADPPGASDGETPGEPPCWNCGSPLPEGAMFCGECGSAVGARAPRTAERAPDELDGRDGGAASEPPAGTDEAGTPPHGDPLIETPASAGEPGFGHDVTHDAPAAGRTPGQDDAGVPPHGDALLGPADRADAADGSGHGAGRDVPDGGAEGSVSPGEDEPGEGDGNEDEPDEGDADEDAPDEDAPDGAPTAVQPVLDDAGREPPHGDPVANGAGAPGEAPGGRNTPPRSADAGDVDDTDDPQHGAADGDEDAGDEDDGDEDDANGEDRLAPLTPEERFAAERLLDPDSPAEKFVLQFSTGESATVYGSGLVGRNPIAEPGEYVDHFVVIRDPGRSVSKTHLEFGQDNGAFWVLDRFSGNGSALREPEGAPKRCEPGRRYFVARGTRVEIGDQFFVVS